MESNKYILLAENLETIFILPTHSPRREKVITSNQYNLTDNLCEKVTQPGIEPRTFALRMLYTPELFRTHR